MGCGSSTLANEPGPAPEPRPLAKASPVSLKHGSPQGMAMDGEAVTGPGPPTSPFQNAKTTPVPTHARRPSEGSSAGHARRPSEGSSPAPLPPHGSGSGSLPRGGTPPHPPTNGTTVGAAAVGAVAPSPGMSPVPSGGLHTLLSETVWMAKGLSNLSNWMTPTSSGSLSLDAHGSRGSEAHLPPAMPIAVAIESRIGIYPGRPNRSNEDSGASVEVAGYPGVRFFGVCDGHGPYGADCSRIALERAIERLPHHIRKLHGDVGGAMSAALKDSDSKLHRNKGKAMLSGTTALTAVLSGTTLTLAHVGDSRAVAGVRTARGAAVTAQQLTRDHNPRIPEERERVQRAGGVILTVDQLDGKKPRDQDCCAPEFDTEGDPPRVWALNADWPGTAFTRSLGDGAARRVGVICVPEVNVLQVDPETMPFVLMASDGLWEFVSGQEAVDMVVASSSIQEAVQALAKRAEELWLENEPRSDDTTIILVLFDKQMFKA